MRDRKLEKALAAMKKRPKPAPKKQPAKPQVDKPSQTDTAKAGQDSKPAVKTAAKPQKPTAKKKELVIDFDGLNERMRVIKAEGSEYRLFWSPEGSRLGFISTSGSKRMTMKVSFIGVWVMVAVWATHVVLAGESRSPSLQQVNLVEDPGWPGVFPEESHSLVINLRYDENPQETSWSVPVDWRCV